MTNRIMWLNNHVLPIWIIIKQGKKYIIERIIGYSHLLKYFNDLHEKNKLLDRINIHTDVWYEKNSFSLATFFSFKLWENKKVYLTFSIEKNILKELWSVIHNKCRKTNRLSWILKRQKLIRHSLICYLINQ